MCGKVFGMGIALLLAGCIIRSHQPVTEKKSIGRLLDDAFRGTVKVADEVAKVDSLVTKAAKTKLAQDEVEILMVAIVKGGSESIAKFMEVAIRKLDEVGYSVNDVFEEFSTRVYFYPVEIKEELINLRKNGKPLEAANLIKQGNIAKDEGFLLQLQSLNKQLDEVAEAVADNHRLAASVGEALYNDTPFKMRFATAEGGFNSDDVAFELMIGEKNLDVELLPFNVNKDIYDIFRICDEIAGTNLWNKLAHIELMLKQADDGKPIYTKISKDNLQKMGIPFDKNFTEPTVRVVREGESSYLYKLYKGPNKVDDKALLEELLKKHHTTY